MTHKIKLRARKAKKEYKNTNAWLDAVYRKNKEFIDSKILPTGTSKRATFKKLVTDYIEDPYGYSPVKALDTLTASTLFTDVGDRLKANAYEGLKKEKEAYKAFRQLTKDKHGRYTEIDLDNFAYDEESNSYIYDNKIYDKESDSYILINKIRVKYNNSPFGIIVEVIE